MLIHKCKMMFVTYSSLNKNTLKFKLNNTYNYEIKNYEGPQLKCGRLCLINLNSKSEVKNLFLVDSYQKPFQVFGIHDVLSEGCVIYDETKELMKENAYATQICIHAFNSLFKNEIENFKNDFLELENSIFDLIMNYKLGWKTAKKHAIEIIEKTDLNLEIKNKLVSATKIAPMPKTALNKSMSLNLEDYNDSVFVSL